MKAFRFRGERLLEWRRAQADVVRLAFVRATESVREAAARLDQAEADSQRAAQEFTHALQRSVDISTIERYRIWIDRRQEDVLTCRRGRDERRAEATTAAGALQEARQRVKVLERLRERAEERHQAEERRADMKALDEIATMRFARQKMQEGATRDDRSNANIQ